MNLVFFIFPLSAISTHHVISGGSSPSRISSDNDRSPSCNERKQHLAIQMLRGYAVLHREPIDETTFLSDAQAVLGEGFETLELERIVANVTLTYSQLRNKLCDQDPKFKRQDATPCDNAIATPQANAFATSQGNAFATPQFNAFATPQDNTLATSQGNTFATSHDNTLATSHDNTLATSQDNTFATSENNTLATPQANPFATPQDNILATSQDKPFATSHDNTLATPQDNKFATSQHNTLATPQGNILATPQGNAFATPHDNAFATPQGSALATSQDNKFDDRHIKAMKATLDDFDCMHREFDLSSVNYNSEDAIEVLRKCRLVVLRNALDKECIQAYRKEMDDYLGGLHSGRVSPYGRTTHGEGGFYLERSPHRWEILLPRSHASKETIVHDSTMTILRDSRILSERMIVHSTGAVIAESGAVRGEWHRDDNYIFEGSGASGIAGHDGPIYAVTMMTPMLNVTFDHGPTEFCMGTSHLTGLSETPVVFDESLIAMDSPYETMIRFLQSHQACPPHAWRAPQLSMGDMVLFDYQIIHRGGANVSPDLRAMLYTTYSRSWFRDSNFDLSMFQATTREGSGESISSQMKLNSKFDELTASTRFAIPDQMKGCQGIECIPMEQIKHFMLNDKSTHRENSPFIMDDFVAFTICNVDFNIPNGLVVIFVDGFFEVDLPVGQCYHATDVQVGSTLDIRDLESGVVYKEWVVCHNQGQIVVTRG